MLIACFDDINYYLIYDSDWLIPSTVMVLTAVYDFVEETSVPTKSTRQRVELSTKG